MYCTAIVLYEYMQMDCRRELDEWQLSESAGALRVRLAESERQRHELELVGATRRDAKII